MEGLTAFQCGPTRFEIGARDVTGADVVQRQLIVHETRAETSEDEATSIQAVFGALVEDEHRIEQTCADVHDAVAAGRICPVLTQRTDHLEAIVARLRAPGDDALVLRGELSKKARVAVTDAMASRPEGTGIMLVATGSYLGEGFDWPELDTLFVAFPSPFGGEWSNTSDAFCAPIPARGALSSTTTSTLRIPVLDRMHGKRLSAYSILGFDVPRRRRHPGRPRPSR